MSLSDFRSFEFLIEGSCQTMAFVTFLLGYFWLW
jgi:hypothetical protein